MRSFKMIRGSVPFLLLPLALIALSGCPGDDTPDPYCGDGLCQLGEGENATTCPEDCHAVCGDGACTGNETHGSCANDCPVSCGDGSCDGSETYQTCPGDCPAPPVCGDGVCNGAENSSSCPGDCPANACTGNFPVDCHDGTGCWTSGTNCSSNVFSCGGARRCASTADWAYCCGGAFLECPAAAPYFCPQDGLCYSGFNLPGYCSVSACSVVTGDC